MFIFSDIFGDIFTHKYIRKNIYTIVTGSGLPLAKVCLKGNTNPRKIYKKIRETLVKKQIINNNTGLKWTIHGEEIMINQFIDLSDLLRIINKSHKDVRNGSISIEYESVYDVTEITFQGDSNNICSELEHLYNLKELFILQTIKDKQLIILSHIHSLERLSLKTFTNILTIPDEYANLKNLHIFQLNGFGSHELLISAPYKLGILRNLKHLDLANNNIDSSVASLESIIQLKKLEYLDLSSNNLTGLPDIFDRLLCLRELNISNNYISEYPFIINRIHSLEILCLSENRLTKFPDIQLPNLRNLYIDYNRINSDNIDSNKSNNINIPKLEKLRLMWNRLSSIPKFIYSLQNLRELWLKYNHINLADINEYILQHPNIEKIEFIYE
jgi:Leucine-rich repeat (LRR) protein